MREILKKTLVLTTVLGMIWTCPVTSLADGIESNQPERVTINNDLTGKYVAMGENYTLSTTVLGAGGSTDKISQEVVWAVSDTKFENIPNDINWSSTSAYVSVSGSGNSWTLSVNAAPNSTKANVYLYVAAKGFETSAVSWTTIFVVPQGGSSTGSTGTSSTSSSTQTTTKVAATKVTIQTNTASSSKMYLKKGKTAKLNYALAPANAKKTYSCSSSNANVVTFLSANKIKAVGEGSATVTVTTASGKKDSIKVVVTKKAVKMKKLTLKKISSIKVGQTKTIKVKKSTAKSTATLKFKSSNQKVLAVDDFGNITGVSAGKAKITIKASPGKSVKMNITVK